MKILFAIKRMEGAAGGAERVLAQVSSRLAGRGHDVALLTFDRPGTESFYPLAPNVRRIFLPVGDPAKPSGFRDTLRRIPALRAAVRTESPDIVIGFMHSLFVPMAFALIGTGIPLIASEHIVPAHYRARRLEFALLIVAAFLARKITVVSEQVRSLYPPFLRPRMVALPNPVEIPPVSARQTDSRLILSAGRLDPQKDQILLIEAFTTLAPRYPDWTLRILGEGPLRKTLEAKIKETGLSDRIALPGIVTDIASEYARADLFVMPSLYESFGLTTAEAMASRLPVIGFADCPGTNELVADGQSGLLVRERTPGALAEAMETLIRDKPLRLRYGETGTQRLKSFDPEKIADMWETLICQTTKKSFGPG